jgi:hypothetical protein
VCFGAQQQALRRHGTLLPGRLCLGGICVAGPTAKGCNDNNECTTDRCEPGIGCLYEPNNNACNDGNVCTNSDRCTAGVCIGEPVPGICNDDNDCTLDWCAPDGGCLHKFLPECRPGIVIDYPLRSSQVDGVRDIKVTGHVEYPMEGMIVPFVNINGLECMTNPVTDKIQCRQAGTGLLLDHYPMRADHGINPIVAEAEAILIGQTERPRDRLVQSFYYSPQWFPVSEYNPDASMIFDAFKMFLGPKVWDDNDTSTPNDIATIITLFVQNLNIANLIQNPVTTGKTGWCKYKVNINNIRYGAISIDLVPINQGLHLKAIIPNFRADIKVSVSGFLCPSFSGNATASRITIDADVLLYMQNGEPVATLVNPRVRVEGLNIHISGIWGFLFNWIIDFFEDDFARMIEQEFEKQMATAIAEAIGDAIKGLALDQTFDIPSFLEGGNPVTLRIKTRISTLEFTPAGGTIGMSAAIVTPKRVPYPSKGSIGRANCLNAGTEPRLNFPKRGQLEVGLHDDFLNLIPYGMWWGGGLTFPVDSSLLGDVSQELATYGISELSMRVDFTLPPILSACNPGEKLMFQAGDIKIMASMKLFGMPVQMLLYASLNAEAAVTIVDTPEGKQLGLAVSKPIFIDIEIAALSGGLAGAEDTLGNLIKDMMLPQVMALLTGDALATFPIPEIDLHAISPELPVGSKIAIELREIIRVHGNTVASGEVQ